MQQFAPYILILVGLLAGWIDSIAGGGGLITVPTLSILLGTGAMAIGTNKVAAAVGSLLALLVYLRQGHVRIKGNRRFALFAGGGALLGSFIAPMIPPEAYKWILVCMGPLMLWVVYRKDLWITREPSHVFEPPPNKILLWTLGFGCGFYDGIAGPGGGTLMFLSLLLVARLPLITAMATAKVSNLTTASLALASFTATGNVHWPSGLTMAAGMAVGAVSGATFATRNASKYARLALVGVSILLFIRLCLA